MNIVAKISLTYQYLYYHIFFWATRSDSFPEITAFWTMAMAVNANIMTLLMLPRPFTSWELTLFAFMFIVTMSLIPQYFCVLHRKRYQRVIKRYESESPRELRHGRVVASLYWIGSMLVVACAALATAPARK